MMSNLLAIQVSPRDNQSISRILTDRFINGWRSANPDGQVVVRDLAREGLPFVDMPWIGGAFAPPEAHSRESLVAIKVSDDLIKELGGADHVVIGTPMYNLNVPAVLKAYLDHIIRVGVTVSEKYEGLLIGKKTVIIVASGGDYSPGTPFEHKDFLTPYLRDILSLIGMTEVQFVHAGATRAVDEGEVDRAGYLERFDDAIARALTAWKV